MVAGHLRDARCADCASGNSPWPLAYRVADRVPPAPLIPGRRSLPHIALMGWRQAATKNDTTLRNQATPCVRKPCRIPPW